MTLRAKGVGKTVVFPWRKVGKTVGFPVRKGQKYSLSGSEATPSVDEEIIVAHTDTNAKRTFSSA